MQSGGTLAEDYRLLADLESRMGRGAQAASDMNRALALVRHLLEVSPSDTEVQGTRCDLSNTAGDIALRSGDPRRALKHYEEAAAVLSKLVSENSRNAGAALRLAGTYNNVGRADLKLRNWDAAAVAFRRALGLAEPLSIASRSNAEAVYTTAAAYAGLGEIEAVLAPIHICRGSNALSIGKKPLRCTTEVWSCGDLSKSRAWLARMDSPAFRPPSSPANRLIASGC